MSIVSFSSVLSEQQSKDNADYMGNEEHRRCFIKRNDYCE